MTALFSLPKLQSLAPRWRVEYFDETDSTNTRAFEAIGRSEITTPTLFLAEHQHQGRGRRSKHWLNSKGKDLLFTAVVQDEAPLALSHQIATSCALALAQALEALGLEPQIKLPNDIYLNQQKVAGILIEHHRGHHLIGIGINVNSTPRIENSTSLLAELGRSIPREILLAKILSKLSRTLELRSNNYCSITQAFRPYDLLYQQPLRYLRNNKIHHGIGAGLSSQGYMLIDHGDGPVEVTAGHDFRLSEAAHH